MSAVNTVTSSSSLTAASNAQKVVDATKETEDRFLKLLVTQMKNQDPLNPLDNAQVTSQMAQLSTVTGINKLNDAVKALSDSFVASQSLQAASLVGHGVMIQGNRLELGSGAAFGGVDLPQAADNVTIRIKDAAGRVVSTQDLGPQDSADSVPFRWDGALDAGGTAADGAYTFEVAAVQGGKKIAATALSVGQVASVSLGVQGATLNVPGFGSISLSQVKQIL